MMRSVELLNLRYVMLHYISHAAALLTAIILYSVSQKIPLRFSDIFPSGCKFLVQILRAYYTFLSYPINFFSITSNCDEVIP